MSVYQNISSRTLIEKGWSGDQKYCAITADGHKYLLRISSIDRLERKRREYEKICEVALLGISMCMPVEFGTCDEGTYSIQSWIDGVDAEETIMAMDADTQYRYGWDAGQILAKIHTIPAPTDAPSWETRFNAKIDRKIAMYESCELKYENGGNAFLDYLSCNRQLLKDRPQSYQHGDYHIGNMMINQDGVLTIIDFDRDDFGDPWEEFNRIVWCAQAAPAFASGMVDGYLAVRFPWISGGCWRCTSAPILSVRSLGQFPLEKKRLKSCGSRRRRCLNGTMECVIPTWYHSR